MKCSVECEVAATGTSVLSPNRSTGLRQSFRNQITSCLWMKISVASLSMAYSFRPLRQYMEMLNTTVRSSLVTCRIICQIADLLNNLILSVPPLSSRKLYVCLQQSCCSVQYLLRGLQYFKLFARK